MRAEVYAFHTEVFPTDQQAKDICGFGQGPERTCVWLAMGPKGLECLGRNKPGFLVDRFEAGETKARRDGCDGDGGLPEITESTLVA